MLVDPSFIACLCMFLCGSPLFFLYFLPLVMKKLFLHQKIDFDQRTACIAPVFWSKYTTLMNPLSEAWRVRKSRKVILFISELSSPLNGFPVDQYHQLNIISLESRSNNFINVNLGWVTLPRQKAPSIPKSCSSP